MGMYEREAVKVSESTRGLEINLVKKPIISLFHIICHREPSHRNPALVSERECGLPHKWRDSHLLENETLTRFTR